MSDLLLMASSPLRSLLSTPGLVACYLPYLQVAQGLTGQTLLDYSSAGNHATLGSNATAVDTADPTWTANALSFDGGDYCTMAPKTTWKFLHDGSPWSFSFVSSMGASTQYLTILNSGLNSSSNIGVYIHTDNDKLQVYIYRGESATYLISNLFDSVGIRDGNTHLLTLTFDYSKASGNVTLYRDGTAIGTANKDGAPNTSVASYDLSMGMNNAGSYGLLGNVYGSMFLSRAMVSGEVKSQYHTLKTLMASQGVTVA